MVDTTFEATYPPEIVAKYSSRVFPATMSVSTRARYVGPSIKTEVRALGVQHFGVFEEPETALLREFASKNGGEAFDEAVRFAEERGRPWSVSGGADVFEPATGTRWTHHRFGNAVEYSLLASVRRVLGLEAAVHTAEPGQTYKGEAILVDGDNLVLQTGDHEVVVHRRSDLGSLPLDDEDAGRPYKLNGSLLVVTYDESRNGTVELDLEALARRSARYDAIEVADLASYVSSVAAFVKCDAMSVEFLASTGALLGGDYQPDEHGIPVILGDEELARVREFSADFTVQPLRPYATVAKREEAISRLCGVARYYKVDARLPAIRDAAEFGAPEWAISAAIRCGGEPALAGVVERYASLNSGARQGLPAEATPVVSKTQASVSPSLNP